jgi:hypothetical protein
MFEGVEVARQVEQVFTPWRSRRDIDEAVEARFAAERKPPRRRQRCPPRETTRQRGEFLLKPYRGLVDLAVTSICVIRSPLTYTRASVRPYLSTPPR